MSQTVGLEVAASIIMGGAVLLTTLACYFAKLESQMKRHRQGRGGR